MSVLIRQRNEMLKEQNDVSGVSKAICKLKQKNNQNKKPFVLKDFITLVKVPRPFPIFIKSAVELKLALQSPEDRCLGGLRENPCTYNYRVCRTDQYMDLFFFTLEQYDKEQFSKEQICQIIRNMNDQYSEEATHQIEHRFKILENYQDQPFLTDKDLQEFELMIGQYPYQCTIQKVNSDNSVLSQRIFNKKFLDVMGITKEMMFDHLKEKTALPTIFDLDGSLKNWCELAKYSVEGAKEFKFYINTYEGQQFQCDVEQKQMFKRFNENEIVFIEFRILKADDRLLNHLIREERIYQNHLDYFNKKNTSLEFNQFKNNTRYVDAKQYLTTKPCGYKSKIIETPGDDISQDIHQQ